MLVQRPRFWFSKVRSKVAAGVSLLGEPVENFKDHLVGVDMYKNDIG